MKAVNIADAEQARDDLAAALSAARIRLPSPAVEAAAYAQQYSRPLLELGRCDVPTARALAAVVRAGTPDIGHAEPTVPAAPENSG